MKTILTREQRAFRQEIMGLCYQIQSLMDGAQRVRPAGYVVEDQALFIDTLKQTQDDLGGIIDEVSTGERKAS